MKEIQHYDKAAHSFYTKQHFKSMPVSAWDMFSHNLLKVSHSLKDIAFLEQLSKKNRWKMPHNIEEEILGKKHVVVVTDVNLRIVHATNTIFDMNGYSPKEILGKQPKMFQGEATCKTTVAEISAAVRNKRPFEAVILNYRKDGSTYRCWIKGQPITNTKGEVVNFIAFEKEVA